jgi:polysaccharide export outer membrane protein
MRNNLQKRLKTGTLALLATFILSAGGTAAPSQARILQPGSVKLSAQDRAASRSTSQKVHVDDDYTIGPSDVLDVNVWKDPELSAAKVPVRPDGRITLPLIGELQVAGLTAMNVQLIVRNKLKAYISDPEVTVIVTEVKSRSYVVVGKISHPGSFDLTKPTTVLEAIAIAGGFLDFAKDTRVYILRRQDNGSTTKFPFNYKKVINQHDTDENIELKNGDTIVVP